METEITEKKCCTCKQIKPLDAFNKASSAKDGLQGRCRECEVAYRKAVKNGEIDKKGGIKLTETHKWCPLCRRMLPLSEFGNHKYTKSGKRTYCRACSRIKKFGWRLNTKGKPRNNPTRMRKRLGLTDAILSEMWLMQGEKCPICGDTVVGGYRKAHLDHDHETDKVRSLLCPKCNIMLGFARDNPDILQSGAEYLIKHKKPSKT